MSFVDWCKKYWALLVGGLIAFVGFLVGVSVKKRPTLSGDNEYKRDLEEETNQQEQAAEQDRNAAVEAIKKENQEAQNKVLADVENNTEDLGSDTNKTNDYLKDVGTKVREKK